MLSCQQTCSQSDIVINIYPKIIKNSLKEEEQLLKTSGILFVEKLIKEYAQGGR